MNDIEILEEMIRVYKQDESNINYSNYYICKCKTERQAIENLIKENKELKEDIKNMYDENVVLNILESELNVSRNEAMEILENY